MQRVKKVFLGKYLTSTESTELEVDINNKDEIIITINDYVSDHIDIIFDIDTAVQFSKELRKQIAYLKSEGND